MLLGYVERALPDHQCVDQPTIPTNVITAPGLQQATSCFSKEPFQTTLRGLASYTLPKIDVRLSGTFRSQPGDPRLATWVVPNTVIAASLGRLPFGALATGTTSVALLDLDEHRLYADNRRSQVDLRVAKLFRFGDRRLDAGFDIGRTLAKAGDGWFGGVDVGRTLNDRIELLAELHGESDDADGHELVVNVGTRATLSEHCTLLASLGTDVDNTSGPRNRVVSYLGLQLSL